MYNCINVETEAHTGDVNGIEFHGERRSGITYQYIK